MGVLAGFLSIYIQTSLFTVICTYTVEVETKDFTVTLTYVKITSSGINCILKNLRGGKSRSKKGY